MAEKKRDIHLRIGPEELVIRQRYQVLSIANDVLIGVWFLIGSFMFFSEALMTTGTWLFVIGSVEMLIRPVIRLIRHLHLQRFRGGAVTADSSYDF
ncbi:YrhK family protein [Brevibacterium oceani]|uniref:YrhK family protein n=1 Tax=Brevibacterium oceani TaxID=358099 RepID=UPI0015E7C075|nr:YrhK family protein [Brevibacterium oceani]